MKKDTIEIAKWIIDLILFIFLAYTLRYDWANNTLFSALIGIAFILGNFNRFLKEKKK